MRPRVTGGPTSWLHGTSPGILAPPWIHKLSATERKHMPDVDVAVTGGWSPRSLQVLKSSYQQADGETMLRVVLGAGELREAR